MQQEKICQICGKIFKKRTKYCSRLCYAAAPRSDETRRKMSAASLGKPKNNGPAISRATKGKLKPHLRGQNNPNYGGKFSNRPDVKEKFLKACKERGQPWGEEQRKRHSEFMSGPNNPFRGKKFTDEERRLHSNRQKERCKNGINYKKYKISKAEKEIAQYLLQKNVKFKTQYHIKGISFIYDFYFPEYNLIIEYQGDYWHANPNKYPSGYMLKIQGVGEKLVNDIWARDLIKKQSAENNGYIIKYIWESDFKKDGFKIVDNLLNTFIT